MKISFFTFRELPDERTAESARRFLTRNGLIPASRREIQRGLKNLGPSIAIVDIRPNRRHRSTLIDVKPGKVVQYEVLDARTVTFGDKTMFAGRPKP